MIGKNQEKNEISAFNMGQAYLERIHKILCICDDSALRSDIGLWLNSVQTLYRELSPLMNQKEIKEYKNITKGSSVNFDTSSSMLLSQIKKQQMHYNMKKIQRAELFLRIILRNKGLLIPLKNYSQDEKLLR